MVVSINMLIFPGYDSEMFAVGLDLWIRTRATFRHAVLACLGLLLATGQAASQDQVVVRGATSASQESRRPGQILDLTGERLLLKTSTGREESIPLDRLVSWSSAKSPEQVRGEKEEAAGRFDSALVQYRAALSAEPRVWMRREILARVVVCQRNLEQVQPAVETFLLIVRSDPTTRHDAIMPLSWYTENVRPDLQQAAERWLSDPQRPRARLLGASWLLATTRRGDADTELQRLATDKNPRIAALAEAQRWRILSATATANDVEIWLEATRRMPAELQGGAWYLIGQTQLRLNQPTDAALALMRVPILYAGHREFAARALLSAAQAMEQAQKWKAARLIYRELITDYQDSASASIAADRLQQLLKQG